MSRSFSPESERSPAAELATRVMLPPHASGRLPCGAGMFWFRSQQRQRHRRMQVWYYYPPALPAAAPIVFVLHGMGRDADRYRDTWMQAAHERQFLLICPRFGERRYSEARYNLGYVINDAGRPRPPHKWTFHVIEQLFDVIRLLTGNVSERYGLYGHSAGAQFVHRLALFMPEARFSTAVAANAGWYTLPTFDAEPFPYSLNGTDRTPSQLARAFARRLVILLGSHDIDTQHPNLRRTPEADRQGRTRVERGHTFFATAQREAAARNLACSWKLAVVPDAHHADAQMMWHAAHFVLEEPRG
jgi:poly(3-hydroxybutyrate) depolymerase